MRNVCDIIIVIIVQFSVWFCALRCFSYNNNNILPDLKFPTRCSRGLGPSWSLRSPSW